MRKTQKEKGRDILSKKIVFPEWNAMDYDRSLTKQLSFYRTGVDDAVKKATFLSYCKSIGKDISKISKLKEDWFVTCGAVAHIITRDIDLEEKHIKYLSDKYTNLAKMKDDTEDSSPKKEVSKEEKLDRELTIHISEFEFGIDDILNKKTFDAKNYLIRNSVKPPMMKKIAAWFKPRLKELKSYETDDQIQEAYSFMSKREFTKFRGQIEGLISACDSASMIVKAARKPRAKKVKSPSVVVAKVKYLKSYPDLNISSVPPEKMVEKDEIWIFNVKTRRLFKYSSLSGNKITVKGTTLIGFDPEKSGGKIIRKPEVQLKSIESLTSRPINQMYNGIKAVASKANGRINEDCIILKCF